MMGYIANLYKYPITEFVNDINKSGADACLVVDAPHELKEENILREELNKKGLSLIKKKQYNDNIVEIVIRIHVV